jgi:8-oxo-dGTP pyrophosphatase MutT (NUDIX family)
LRFAKNDLVTPLPVFTPLSSLPNFDPRKVAVAGVDAHLPRVEGRQLQAEALRLRFQKPPLWQPEVREEPKYAERSPMHAAVLVPIVMRREPTLLLTERTTHLSTHSGQIAFPGGKADEDDADAAATALREAEEEVGLDHGFVQILGTLPVYVTGTSFIITPVVALVEPGFSIRPNANEVADVFEVPLGFLMDPANHQRHQIDINGLRREWFSMPYDEPGRGESRFIWGATAGMLRNLYRFLVA